MKVTVDINVLLDVFQKREPHYAASARMLAMVQQGDVASDIPMNPLTTDRFRSLSNSQWDVGVRRNF